MIEAFAWDGEIWDREGVVEKSEAHLQTGEGRGWDKVGTVWWLRTKLKSAFQKAVERRDWDRAMIAAAYHNIASSWVSSDNAKHGPQLVLPFSPIGDGNGNGWKARPDLEDARRPWLFDLEKVTALVRREVEHAG